MQAKTKRKIRMKSKAGARSASSYRGAMKLLQLLGRAEGTENITNVVASQAALDLLEWRIGGF